ncbi:hypothetical protein SAMN05518683_108157 [Salibacterium halotolerans]|uniref:Uncharacterized protein n=1 Tax=Salibacterium halotolerans TaxID=1884432 RepID=A0A1I5SF48_9BACI|nr:hypothetical protein SAMN05518683_108157 [Salibacterium halotolerans]
MIRLTINIITVILAAIGMYIYYTSSNILIYLYLFGLYYANVMAKHIFLEDEE